MARYAKENFLKIPSSEKELMEIDKAKHADVWKIGGDAYFDKVLSFLNTHSKENDSSLDNTSN